MTHPLPCFPPLFPSGNWWRSYLKALSEGISREKAVELANAESGMRSRDWLRISVAGAGLLSLPVEGGASSLKNRHPSLWRFSRESAREARKIKSTLATVYGRSPFHYLLAGDFEILPGVTESESLPVGRECIRLFRVVEHILLPDAQETLEYLKGLSDSDRMRLKALGEEKSAERFLSESILDLVFRYGPDAIFPLLPAF